MDSYTQFMYDMATSPQLKLHDAVALLRKDAHVRSVRDTLSKLTGIPPEDRGALQTTLTDALMETSPGGKRDSVARKVRMWMADDVRFVRKESAIQLCFALKLPLRECEELLYRLCGEGFHWRDPRDIVYIYARTWELTYDAAAALLSELEKEKLLQISSDSFVDTYTAEVREMVRQLGTPEELKAFFRENGHKLGAFHNTAYQLFQGFLELLIQPELNDQLEVDEKYSIRSIMHNYFHDQLIPRLKQAAKGDDRLEAAVLSALQEDIRQNWPDEMTISKMQHRKVDVTRKVLVLLFLATDGGVSGYGGMDADAGDYDDYADALDAAMSPGQYFEDMLWRMNSMLIECGFAPLDSRAPFDWMILFCMCADDSIFIDERLQHFLMDLFSGGTEAPEL